MTSLAIMRRQDCVVLNYANSGWHCITSRPVDGCLTCLFNRGMRFIDCSCMYRCYHAQSFQDKGNTHPDFMHHYSIITSIPLPGNSNLWSSLHFQVMMLLIDWSILVICMA